MGDETCSICEEKISDPKFLIQCTQCSASFHSNCIGITDLRGFHMKKASWKCQICNVELPVDQRKRKRSETGESVMVDRNFLSELLDAVKTLNTTVSGIKEELVELRQENKCLLEKLHAVQSKSNGKPNSTFASIVGQGRGTPSSVSKKMASTSQPKSKPITVEEVSTAVSKALGDLNTNEQVPNNNEYQVVSSRRSRIRKPVMIGSLECDSNNQSGSPKFEGTERRHWVYVGRVKVGTTVEVITGFVKSKWSLDDVACVKLAERDDICSFKVGVKESHIPSLLDASKWPKGVAVREFVFIPSRGRKPNAGDFQQGENQNMET